MTLSDAKPASHERRSWWPALVLIIGGLAVVVSGFIGYSSYLVEASFFDNLFYAFNLVALNFYTVPDGGAVPALLHAARLGAHVIAGLGLFLALGALLRRQTERWRGIRSRNHVVVIGDDDHAIDVAIAYRSHPENGGREHRRTTLPVCIMGEFGEADSDLLHRHRIKIVDGLDDSQLRGLLAHARRVVVTAATDPEVMQWWSRLLRVGAHRSTPIQLIVDDPQFAVELRRGVTETADHRVDVCCANERIAQVVLRDHPPRREGEISPPPTVIGDGALAHAVVRSMVLGWEVPGFPLEIRCLTTDSSWVQPLEDDLAGRARLHAEQFGQGAHLTSALSRAVEDHLTHWQGDAVALQRLKSGEPLIVIAGPDDATAFALQHRLGEMLDSGCIVAIVDESEAFEEYAHSTSTTEMIVVGRRRLLASPTVLEENVVSRLARVLADERRHWPSESQSAFDQLDDAMTEDNLAGALLTAARAAGLLPGEHRSTFILTPGELRAIADHLHSTLEDSDNSVAQRHVWIALAATIPNLFARVGHPITATARNTGPRLRHDDIEQLAKAAHERYKARNAAVNPTGSALGEQTWESLSEFHKESNRAQVRDIPVKLAVIGRDLVRADSNQPPDVSWLDDDVVEQLAELEHVRWCRLHLAAGYSPGAETEHMSRTHTMLRPWAELDDEERDLDRGPVRDIPVLLAAIQLTVAETNATAGPG